MAITLLHPTTPSKRRRPVKRLPNFIPDSSSSDDEVQLQFISPPTNVMPEMDVDEPEDGVFEDFASEPLKTALWFGQYKGKTFESVIDVDRRYILWYLDRFPKAKNVSCKYQATALLNYIVIVAND